QVARPGTSAFPGAPAVLPAAPGTGTCRSCLDRSGRAPRGKYESPRRARSRLPSTVLPASDGLPCGFLSFDRSTKKPAAPEAPRAQSCRSIPVRARNSLTVPGREEAHLSPRIVDGADAGKTSATIGPLGVWRSLVARSVRVGEAPSSNLGTPIPLLYAGPGRPANRPL